VNQETRRLITAMLAAMAVFFLYQFVYFTYFAPPPPVGGDPNLASPDANTPLVRDANSPAAPGKAPESSDRLASDTPAASDPNAPQVESSDSTMRAAPDNSGKLRWAQGQSTESIKLGDRDNDLLELELSPIGASVANLYLTEHRSNGKFAYASDKDETTPYRLLKSIETDAGTMRPYSTHRLVLHQDKSTSFPLDQVTWHITKPSDQNGNGTQVSFWTELALADGSSPLLRLTKTYRLRKDVPLFDIFLDVQNLTNSDLSVTLEQDGPIGLDREQAQYDMRTLIGAYWDGQNIKLASKEKRAGLRKKTVAAQNDQDPATLGKRLTTDGVFAWTAATNRFFGAFTRVVNDELLHPDVIQAARGFVLLPKQLNDGAAPGDMQVRLITHPIELSGGESARRAFEIYTGPKDTARLEDLSEAYADSTQLGYHLAEYADRYCMCTFQGLPWLMRKILHGLQAVVINYGIAIIILVVLIRSLMHRLTVFQQRSMFKTQEGMARIQPKMAEIKQKYADDSNKQNQEMMRLFSEEGVNPAAGLVSMVPMFIQMPILVAMWMSINGDVDLRHASFVFWMDDLSQPDQFIRFADWGMPNGLTIPLLGQLLPGMFANIPAINLLPIVMGVGMYLQQKYMPKPGQKERAEARRKQAEESGDMTQFEQQMKQQETIAVMMSFMFPLMFYYMPSGLNLYWLATTVFGIGETLLIRRQLEREKAEGKLVSKPRKGPGPISRFFAHLAEQAEEFQKQADELSGKSNKGAKRDESKDKHQGDESKNSDKPKNKKGRR
jgi:YidC/Oxa1 family membrane protein insertase